MKHLSLEDCVNVARQVEDEDQRMTEQEHLDTGCAECSNTVNIWRRVVKTVNHETSCSPPAWAVQAVLASFAARKVPQEKTPKLELAKLLFDSALEPAVAGVRGTACVARQLLFRSGSFCIDMRLQPTPGSESMVLIGQLLDSSKPDHGMRGIPVSLLCKGDTVSKGHTNDVGEFDFGLASPDDVQLVFGMGNNTAIVVPVPKSETGRKIM
jgi:hypothetical protein